MAQVTTLHPAAYPMAVRLGSFAGKVEDIPSGAISVVIDQKDLRLVRPRVLKCLWWLIVGVSWLCL